MGFANHKARGLTSTPKTNNLDIKDLVQSLLQETNMNLKIDHQEQDHNSPPTATEALPPPNSPTP